MSVLRMEMKLFLMIYVVCVVGTFLTTISDYDNVTITPIEIYEGSDLNIIACILIFIISLLLNPLFYIAHFIDWLFHVGRKE